MPYDYGNWGSPPGGGWGGSGDWGGWQQPPMTPGVPSLDPRQIVRMIDPVAQHGLRQLQAGVNPLHVMREVASGGYLVASGYPAYQAIQIIEEWERLGQFR